jgi:hypothetical protein
VSHRSRNRGVVVEPSLVRQLEAMGLSADRVAVEAARIRAQPLETVVYVDGYVQGAWNGRFIARGAFWFGSRP